MAFALGEVSKVAGLGERLYLEIKILNKDSRRLESSCVQLQKPRSNEDIPWLQQASINIIGDSGIPALLISSNHKMLEPVLREAMGYVIRAAPFEVAREARLDFLRHRINEPDPELDALLVARRDRALRLRRLLES